MILKIRSHTTVPTMVVIDAGPELASFMGGFGPARWQRDSRCYWLEVEHLEAFRRYVGISEHTVVDTRSGSSSDGEKFSGPLPECWHCGQPAARSTAMSLGFCPACGREWEPWVHQPTPRAETSAVAACEVCGHHQPARYGFCGKCGCTITRPLTPVARESIAVVRGALAEPMLFGDTIAESPQLQPGVDALAGDAR